jgi:hypothetical protein
MQGFEGGKYWTFGGQKRIMLSLDIGVNDSRLKRLLSIRALLSNILNVKKV